MSRVDEASTGSGHETLPDEQQKVLKKAIKLEWLTIISQLFIVALVGLVAGQSQAMRAAWMEDMLSLLPPIAFLIATRVIKRRPNRKHPYGYHRSIGVAHQVAALALLTMGSFLLFDSVMGLIKQDKPPIGLTVLFGYPIWAGWLMIAVMGLTAFIPVMLGRAKIKLAKPIHDKVLFADADMSKADWTTALATIVGVLGIGVGLWWMDAVAAIVVASSIVKDGISNLKAAVEDLTDTSAMDLDENPHPLIPKLVDRAHAEPWVLEAEARVRDQGHVFHVELFVVPRSGMDPSIEQLHQLRDEIRALDWKLHDIVVIPMRQIPAYLK